MAETVHEHTTHDHTDQSSGMGFMLGLVALILFMYLLFAFGLPALRRSTAPPSVNVPEQIDVNVNPGGGQ